jgi:hypothetical protein
MSEFESLMQAFLSAVLTKEPDWNRIPGKIQLLLRSCLEKEPRRRLRDIGDAWRLLGDENTACCKKEQVTLHFYRLPLILC